MKHIVVISDLHLGGRPDSELAGTQICNSYEQLVMFIDWLASGAAALDEDERDAKLDLVINGDIVDFLASDDYVDSDVGTQVWTPNEDHVITKLERIIERTTCANGSGVFQSLGHFLDAGHDLTLILGNHDVELALPKVRRHLKRRLGGDTRNLRFIYDGESYAHGPVLIEHGNRYDAWNMIDHSALRQERAMRSRRLPIKEEERSTRYFRPPAGTHLVVHFMNRIKEYYRFIDLLKPEAAAVVPLLLCLEPERRATLDDILKAVSVATARVKHGLEEPILPKIPGDMSPGETNDAFPTLNEVLEDVLGYEEAQLFWGPDTHGDLGTTDGGYNASRWLKTRLASWKRGVQSLSSWIGLLRTDGDTSQRLDRLHSALRHLNSDDISFDLAREQTPYHEAARQMADLGGFEIVVFGHTHLPKRFSLDSNKSDATTMSWYYNSGTWADVMRLPAAVRGNDDDARQALASFVEALKNNDFTGYVRRYLSFVEIVVADNGDIKRHGLYSWCGPGRERADPLTDIHDANADGGTR